MIDRNHFVEWAEYLSKYYGTSELALMSPVTNSYNPIIELDVNAATKLIDYCDSHGIAYKDVFVLPLSKSQFKSSVGEELALKTIHERMICRGRKNDLTPEQMKGRLKIARTWLSKANDFNYLLENVTGGFSDAEVRLREIIESRV